MSEDVFAFPGQELEQFINFARGASERCAAAEKEQSEADSAIQDILHSLELEFHNDEDCLNLAIALRDQRRRRRVAKDTIARLSPVAKWYIANQTNAVRAIEKARDATRSAEQSLANRSYHCRTDVVQQALQRKTPNKLVSEPVPEQEPSDQFAGSSPINSAAVSLDATDDLASPDTEPPPKKKKKKKAEAEK